jgi:hypothetical protein
VFLDPPYTSDDVTTVYRDGLHDRDVTADVVAWCVEHGDDPDYRIVLAEYTGAADVLAGHGWREVEWHTDGYLTKGYGEQSHRERLWASPHCVAAAPDPQMGLFDDGTV